MDNYSQLSFDFGNAQLTTPDMQREIDINKIKEITAKDFESRTRTENDMLNKYRQQYGDLDALIKSTEPVAQQRTKQDIIQDIMNKPES